LADKNRYKRIGFGFCNAGLEEAYYTLDPTGNVRPCNHSSTILGNIHKTSFAEMVRSQKMRDFFAARPAFCSGCDVEDACLGGCKAAAEVCTGCIDGMDPFLSAFAHRARKPAHLIA
jgi:radical SAM protein with 4Fe4S-binding SPASM domain